MVFAGKLGTLLAVKDMLSESVPVVLVAESGGVADFIRFGVEFLKETGEPQKVLKFQVPSVRSTEIAFHPYSF